MVSAPPSGAGDSGAKPEGDDRETIVMNNDNHGVKASSGGPILTGEDDGSDDGRLNGRNETSNKDASRSDEYATSSMQASTNQYRRRIRQPMIQQAWYGEAMLPTNDGRQTRKTQPEEPNDGDRASRPGKLSITILCMTAL